MALSKAEQRDINWTALSEEDAELFESLQSAVSALGDEADHPMIEVRDKLAIAFRDKAALLKRNWTDEMFQEGQHLNEEKVAEIEAAMATDLGSFGGGLQNGQNLGNALDLVGAYMKNYKLDKADAVLAKCGPFVSHRGGVWMVKWLNHDGASVQSSTAVLSSSWPEVSTVRMKQSRHLEALAPRPLQHVHIAYGASCPSFHQRKCFMTSKCTASRSVSGISQVPCSYKGLVSSRWRFGYNLLELP